MEYGIIGLKELSHGKEVPGHISGPWVFPLVYEVKDLGEDVGKFSRDNQSVNKHMDLLGYCALLKMLGWVGASTCFLVSLVKLLQHGGGGQVPTRVIALC